MILSFRGRDTERFFNGERVQRFFEIGTKGADKLDMLNAATRLDDLKSPPGNRLEALRGGRAGQHSIRINDKWRVCFCWTENGAADVEIVDYH